MRLEVPRLRPFLFDALMQTFPIRLTPGQDLRQALEAAVRSQRCRAAFVLRSEERRVGKECRL